MFNTTYTLEDNGSWYTPSAEQPHVCDACMQAIEERFYRSPHWKSVHALRACDDRFTVLDYAGVQCSECRCCHTTKLGERYLVHVQRKPVR